MAEAVDVDDHWCVIRGHRFSFPRLAIDLSPTDAMFNDVVTGTRCEESGRQDGSLDCEAVALVLQPNSVKL